MMSNQDLDSLKQVAGLSCPFGLFGLSGLSRLFGLSCLFNWFDSKNERNQTNQLTRWTRSPDGFLLPARKKTRI